MNWLDLPFWQGGELQAILEKLDDRDKAGARYSPAYNPTTLKRDKIFKVFDECPLDTVKVLILGQDPYPNPKHATGVAFEVPPDTKIIPLTLAHMLREYSEDLHKPYPTETRLLTKWTRQGVLLLNQYLTCLENNAGTHMWPEYEELTRQVFKALQDKGCGVYVLLGGKAHKWENNLAPWCHVIKTSHPSPLGVTKENPRKGVSPFKGSRIFSRINAALAELKQPTIDWSLP